MPLPPRLAKFIRLLASDKPGEVVAAAGAINRTLQSAGMDIHNLADVVESAPSARQAPPKAEPNEDDADTRRWRDMRAWCAERAEHLSPREREFLDSLKHWRGTPTAKQMNWLRAIEQRLRRRQAP